jgi:hypothetical protein
MLETANLMSESMIFIGYRPIGAYKLYNPRTNKVMLSRDEKVKLGTGKMLRSVAEMRVTTLSILIKVNGQILIVELMKLRWLNQSTMKRL